MPTHLGNKPAGVCSQSVKVYKSKLSCIWNLDILYILCSYTAGNYATTISKIVNLILPCNTSWTDHFVEVMFQCFTQRTVILTRKHFCDRFLFGCMWTHNVGNLNLSQMWLSVSYSTFHEHQKLLWIRHTSWMWFSNLHFTHNTHSHCCVTYILCIL